MSDVQSCLFKDENAPFHMADVVLDPAPFMASPVKIMFDWIVAVTLLVPLCIIAILLLFLNPFLNAGPLFYVQKRMGLHCRAFPVLKFRTMRNVVVGQRGAFDVLEADRMTAFGRFLRKSRIDELPQVLNVLRGQMSMIGPRPDAYHHAQSYLRLVPGYAQRHQVMPGISGLAQTEVGYVDDIAGVQRKVVADLIYIENAGLSLDLWITWRTIVVVFGRRGA